MDVVDLVVWVVMPLLVVAYRFRPHRRPQHACRRPNACRPLVSHETLRVADHVVALPILRQEIRRPRQGQGQDVLILLTPGNPGVPAFYAPYLQCLSALVAANTPPIRHVSMICVGHAGHTPPQQHVASSISYSLRDQTQHKVAFVQQRVMTSSPPRIILIGHSIGAQMTMTLFDQFAPSIVHAIFLHPTLRHMGRTPAARRLALVFRFRKILVAVLSWCRPVATRFVDWGVTCCTSWCRLFEGSCDLRRVISALVRDSVVRQILDLAVDELQHVGEFRPSPVLVKEQAKCTFIYGQGDPWVRPEDQKVIRQQLPAATFVDTDVDHAFMLSRHGSQRMARMTWDAISAHLT